MSTSFSPLSMVIYGVNIVLGLLLLWLEDRSSSDKTIYITALSYLLLVVLNLVMGVSAGLGGKRTNARHYFRSVVVLIVLVVLYVIVR